MEYSARPKISKWLPAVVAAVMIVVPFWGFLPVYISSLTGHYTAWRLFDEVLLVVGLIFAAYLLFRDKAWKRFFKQPLVWLIGAYVLLQIISGAVALAGNDVSKKALGYGLIVDLRFLLFFLVVLVAAQKSPWLKKNWRALLLIPAAIVVIFGLLQHFVLPQDFLSHFGYNASTIRPYETINHNMHYLRIMSTLRGANPLGAYLVIIVPALTLFFLKASEFKSRLGYGIFWLAAVADVYFSGSRGAWVGTALAVLIILALQLKKTQRKMLGLGLVVIVVAGAALGFSLRHNTSFQNEIYHTQNHSKIKSTSDAGHLSAFKSGLHDVIHQPLGRGPGTAGPASVYNQPRPARIAENYFLQIGQEVGWLGLALFIAINILVALLLWRARQELLAMILLASLAGITLVNFLSHAWADDTLAYVWWGLAGVSCAPHLLYPKQKR